MKHWMGSESSEGSARRQTRRWSLIGVAGEEAAHAATGAARTPLHTCVARALGASAAALLLAVAVAPVCPFAQATTVWAASAPVVVAPQAAPQPAGAPAPAATPADQLAASLGRAAAKAPLAQELSTERVSANANATAPEVSPRVSGAVNAANPAEASWIPRATVDIRNADPQTHRTPTTEDGFYFQLTEVDAAGKPLTGGYTDTAANNGGAVTFKTITYTAPGTHYYQVSELQGNDSTLAYDTEVRTVTVTVTENGGTLTATPSALDVAKLTFSNLYTPTPATLDITGTIKLAGRAADAGLFQIDLVDNQSNKAASSFKSPALNADQAAQVTFASFAGQSAFTRVGSYSYTLKDVMAGNKQDGVTHDQAAYNVNVTVSENTTTHALVATPDITDGEGNRSAIAFNNTYEPQPVIKSLDGRVEFQDQSFSDKKLTGDDFTFTVQPATGAPAPERTSTKNNTSGLFSFGNITFATAGTYEYTVSQQNGGKGGYQYDGAQFKVVYTVKDDGKGTLSVEGPQITKVGTGAQDSITFKNVYKPASVKTGALGGTVKVKAEAGNSYTVKKDDFTVELRESRYNNVYQSPKVEDGGAFSIYPLTFSQPGTFEYTVRLKKPDANAGEKPKKGITYDTAIYTLTYTVEDQNGTLKITNVKAVKSDGTTADPANLTFTNDYNPDVASWSLDGTVTIKSTDEGFPRQIKDGEFSFTLQEQGGDNVSQTVSNKGGAFSFAAITYTKPGTHTYKLFQKATSDSTITEDGAEYTITVNVTDENGVLDATPSKAPEGGYKFENDFTPTPAQATIDGAIKLTGRDAHASEFEVQLIDQVTEKVIQTAKNDEAADGQQARFSFQPITYTKVGTYRYRVALTQRGNRLSGVTYDYKVYTVEVQVTAGSTNDPHVLTATPRVVGGGTGSDLTFENTYEATVPAQVQFEGTVKLKGKALKSRQFRFRMTDGKSINTVNAVNDAQGKILFPKVDLKSAGEITFTLSQVNDKQAGITYSEKTFKVRVKVVDDGKGGFAIQSINYLNGKPVFDNTYKNPKADQEKAASEAAKKAAAEEAAKKAAAKKKLPKTGDSTSLALPAWLALCAGAMLALGWKVRRTL